MGKLKNFVVQLIKQLNKSIGAENRRVIMDFLERDKLAKAIDLGCGEGNFTKELGKRIGTTELYGVDILEVHAERAKQNGVKVCLADLNHPLPIKDDTFDVVHANQVIEHICRTDTFVKEIHRILRGGVCCDFH